MFTAFNLRSRVFWLGNDQKLSWVCEHSTLLPSRLLMDYIPMAFLPSRRASGGNIFPQNSLYLLRTYYISSELTISPQHSLFSSKLIISPQSPVLLLRTQHSYS